MKISKTISTIILAFTVMTGVFSCKNASDPFQVGTAVAAKWSDGSYWTAKITSVAGDKYGIVYDDGTKGDVVKADLKALTPQADLKKGDAVWAVWTSNSKMYQGTIDELKPEGAMVKWNDGSSISMVPFGKIAK